MTKSDSSFKELNFKVHGRVQGVCYRWFVKEEADACSALGWVKNCWDGTVEGVLQGKKQDLEHLMLKMNIGPPLAHVDHVDIQWQPVSEKMLQLFEIRF